jgi:hypothetical protein
MTVSEVATAEKAFVNLANIKVRLNQLRTEDNEEGRLVALQLNRITWALFTLRQLYGHVSKVIPEVSEGKGPK